MIKLHRARSPLYRRQILQEHIRWKALDEIYKIYMLLHRSDLNISEIVRQTFSHFWANFAKNGKPGKSTNFVEWNSIVNNGKLGNSYMIIDNRQNLKMKSSKNTFKSLAEELYQDNRVSELEKCVILLQMFTFVGNDLYDENIKHYPGKCNRSDSENFLIENASFIEY